MGFSTSGSLLVIFFGLLIALGSVYAATSSAGDVVTDGLSDQSDRLDAIHDTDITLVSATWDETDETLEVTATNTGATTIPVEEITVLIDGEYESIGEFDAVTVDGEESTLWQPGTALTLTKTTEEPERVKLVTAVGISVAWSVEVTA